MRRSVALLGALATSLSFALAPRAGEGAPQQPKKPTPSELDKLALRLFDAPEAERATVLARMAEAEPLTAASAKTWAKKLLALAQKGPKLADKGRGFLYDDKAKKGLYLLGGKAGATSLFLGLHGGGEGSGDAGSAQGAWAGAVAGEGWAAIFPEVLAKTEAAWGDEATERFVLDLVESMKRTQKIDTNKIFLGGHSMGGYGTWTIGGRHADLFAGLIAFAGAATPYRNPKDRKTVEGIQEGILPNLRNLPIYVYHSRDDPQVDFETNDFAVKELKKLQAEHGGYVHVFQATDGQGHAFPDPRPALEFHRKHARDPRPKKIVWQPYRPWKRMFYWLWWDSPDPAATLVAEVAAPNRLAIRASGGKEEPKGLSVLLDERLVDLDKEVIVELNGKERFRGKVPRSLAAMAATAAERRDPEMLFVARVPL